MRGIFKKIKRYHSVLGPGRLLLFLLALGIKKSPGVRPLFKLYLAGIRHPVHLRFGTTDAWVFKEVLLDGEYDFLPATCPQVIVDAGANIGLASIFFANKFPEAIIYALEPESSNFALLEKNTAFYPQIKTLKRALWSENKNIQLINPDNGHWGFMTTDKTPNAREKTDLVPAVTLDRLLEESAANQVDILKIDIEGAEKEVFEHSQLWIARVGIIMAELHDLHRPGCSKAFNEATQGFPSKVTKGQTVMCLRADALT